MNVFEIFGTIGLKDKYSKPLEEVGSRTRRAQKKAQEAEDSFKKFGAAVAAAFAVKKIVDFGQLAVESAAAMQAMDAQFEQVFGDMVDVGEKTISQLGEEFGILDNRIKPYFTSMTSKFKGLGMDTESAMEQAEVATNIAADAAAFYDKTLEDAAGSLNSFVNGNYEGGEAIGIFANESQMAQFAIQEGIIGSTKEWQNLDEATKQATRLEYAQRMYDMAGATGQAARESEGWTNVVANLHQAWQDFLAVVGQPILELLIPVIVTLTDILSALPEKIQGIIDSYTTWRSENAFLASVLEGIVVGIGVLMGAIMIYKVVTGIVSAATALWTAATTVLNAVLMSTSVTMGMAFIWIVLLAAAIYIIWQNWSTIGPLLAGVWEGIKLAVSTAWTSTSSWFSDMATTAKEKSTEIFNAVQEWFGKIPGKIEELWEQAQSYLSGIDLYSIGENIVNGLRNGISNAWNGLTSWFSEKVSGLTSLAERALSIFSPSRKFRDRVGRMIPAGIQVGVEDEFPNLEDSLETRLNNLTDIRPSIQGQIGYSSGVAATPNFMNHQVMDALDMIIRLLERAGNQELASYLDGRKVSRELDDPLTQYRTQQNITKNRMKGAYI